MKGSNIFMLSNETVTEAIKKHLEDNVFKPEIKFEITDVQIETAYGSTTFKVTTEEKV